MVKIDFHTHSIASRDGAIRPEQYQDILERGVLDYIVVSDHNRIDMAQDLQRTLGNRIIVGEEISTVSGEIIGLFLKEVVPPQLSALETAQVIRSQDGLVYIPHPFETVRPGLQAATLEQIRDLVDIVEVHNARAFFQNRGPQAAAWARLNRKVRAASSDAHGVKGLGTSYTLIAKEPTKQNLIQLLSKGRLTINRPPYRTLLYPKANRLRKKLKGLRR